MNRRVLVSKVVNRYLNDRDYLINEAVGEIDRIYGVLPDDGEVATYEWMQSVGADVHVYEGDIYLYRDRCFEMDLPQMTRYQFRRLCEALGVELQERKDGE